MTLRMRLIGVALVTMAIMVGGAALAIGEWAVGASMTVAVIIMGSTLSAYRDKGR